ncbi:hypothetical protein SLS56_004054 [Neofusicoccum ribis]|uniref:Cytochrome b5 heme-binding domain-containing protein n=1 Tax=Neofusicoccum ribis TaxID=45134 RepID=A0ABR3SXF4_9PEZI
MLLGISALLISATFLLYNHPPRTWLPFFRDWSARRLAPPPKPADAKPSASTPDDANPTVQSTTTPDPSQKDAPPEKQDERRPPVSIQVPRIEDPPSDAESPQTTPKASTFPTVPTFSVAPDDDDEDENLPPPSFPAMNSAQRASGPTPRSPPKLKPLPAQPPASAMMPPPPPPRLTPAPQRPSGGLMPPPRMPASTLRGGPASPLPNRGPPGGGGGGGGGSSSLALPISGAVKTPNPRAKVSLTPGHSPLDWAALVKSGSNLSGVPALQRVTPTQLKAFNGRKNRQTGEVMPAWSAYQGKVYNITPYLPYHPGGEGELRRAAGKDGEKLFNEVHPWVNWDNMLSECVVGILVPEHSAVESGGSSLDDMD